ncbi:MAG: NAD(P)H-dependent oxidoreductase subunit E [Sedimentisphaerales bacterium]|nr:NAD(P)H-dependent oxidoreductase subunit E [Sedimentisphaerales bacterium]
MDEQIIEKVVIEHRDSLGGILSILTEIQSKFGYLPQDALRQVAKKTDSSLTDIYAVATFYKAFSLKPRGKHLVSVCLGTACHVRGAPKIADEFSRQLGIKSGETTRDKEFSFETVNCLGACALGPTVVVDNHYFSHVTTAKVQHIIEQARKGFQQSDPRTDHRIFKIQVNCPVCNHTLMDNEHEIDGAASIKLAASSSGKKGTIRLSSLYGSSSTDSDGDFPKGNVISIFCPYCREELPSELICPECGANMAMMTAGKYATFHICSRYGCLGHMLDITSQTQDSLKEMKG